ncbi:MAG: 16S rRNA (uracil1498-N3)-methyltransferase [Oleiphilaceae bacterium]|jgi:16S rRNA (uracil1498-N3)-methyltransferase
MRIPTIYTVSKLAENLETELDNSSAHYITNVLRMKQGEQVTLFNGSGWFFNASITHSTKKYVSVFIDSSEKAQTESSLHTHLGQVMSRGDRMDYAIQKSTEMGVNEITPLMSERCELKLKSDRENKRLAHWQQVAISAAEQCGRATVPTIHPVSSLEDWMKQQSTIGLSLVFHHRDTQNLAQIQTPPGHVNLLIGPEGGLSETEIQQAKQANFIACTFGPRVMRTETAPVACISVLQWLWGDLNSH